MTLSKLSLIISREYITRIRSKAFIISTILAPLFILGVIFVPILLTSFESEDEQSIIVLDYTSTIIPFLIAEDAPYSALDPATVPVDSAKKMILEGQHNALIVIEKPVDQSDIDTISFYYTSGGLELRRPLSNDLNRAVQNYKLYKVNAGPEINSIISHKVNLISNRLTKAGAKEDDGIGSYLLSLVMALSIYFALIAYGNIIMRSVVEEKSSRIVEIIVSSVKPIELMLGKVIGVGLLGLTQFVIMALLFFILTTFATPILLALGMGSSGTDSTSVSSMPFDLPIIDPIVWVYFVLFYLLGFFMYASLFAAVGSAADSETDTQQLSTPIIILLVIPMIIITKVSTDPSSTFSVVASLFPFFSPILMMTRIGVTEVPWYEIWGSMILMIGLTYLFIYLGAKIYRIGILMYGKKASFKELFKWMRY